MSNSHATAIRILGALLEARTGQQLIGGRQWRIESALRPVARERGLPTVEALVAHLVSTKDDNLTAQVVDALLNNETSFYRDPGLFGLLSGAGFDRIRGSRQDSKKLRIWSAGCSTGQEPYSIAMMLRDADARWSNWAVEIAATDISDTAVARARRGHYTQFEIQRGLPVRTMLRWFQQEGEEWVADPTLRRMVRFSTHSLLSPPPGQFDVILCRNVLMYFPASVRSAVFDRLHHALAPDGILMLGAGETVIGQTTQFVADPALRGLYVAAASSENNRRRAA